MENFTFLAPTKIIFGKDSIKNLETEIKVFGKNVLLTYGGGSIKKSGIYDNVLNLLKDYNIFELNGIEPNPKIESVRKGIKICKENNIDVILAVGGGSVIDCSKVIAAGYYYDKDAWDLVLNPDLITKALPIVTILTLAATGSEMNKNAVISRMDTNIKKGTRANVMIPKVSILDPTYTYTLPPIQTASGAADIMSHIFENYFQNDKDTDVQDRLAEGLLKTVIKNTPIALNNPKDYSARSNIMWSSSLALNGLTGSGKSGAWTCHTIEHELSAFYDITHGVGLAILTPRWMRHILAKDSTATGRFVKFARNVMGLDGEDEAKLALAGIDALEEYFKSTGIPMTLTELGIDEEHFEVMADHANEDGYLKDAYVALTNEDIVQIYKACL